MDLNFDIVLYATFEHNFTNSPFPIKKMYEGHILQKDS